MKQKRSKNRKIIIVNKIRFENNWLSFFKIFIVLLIIICFIGIIYSVCAIIKLDSSIQNVNIRVDKIEKVISNPITNTDSSIIDYYRELSDKTDAAIDRILAIVGLLATIVTFFGLLLTFKAPNDVTDRLNEVSKIGECAAESARTVQYQLDIFVAINFDSNGDSSNYARIEKLTKVIQSHPNRCDAYFMRARCYDQLGQELSGTVNDKSTTYYALAINDYAIAMALGADLGQCNNNIGFVYSAMNKPEEALDYYTAAINANPSDVWFRINRGGCYELLGEYEKSLADYERAIVLDDKNYSAYYGRSYTYRSLWNQSTDELKKAMYIKLEFNDLQTAIEINPQFQSANKRLEELLNYIHTNNIAIV